MGLWGATDDIAFDASYEWIKLLMEVLKTDAAVSLPGELRKRIVEKMRNWGKAYDFAIAGLEQIDDGG